MASLEERLDRLEAAIKKPSFRQNKGKANEVNYWVFDYPPEKELEVRERIAYLRNKNTKGTDGFELVVYDLYDIIMDHLESKNFVSKCKDFEGKKGISYVATTIQRTLKITDKDNLIVRHIIEHTPENAVVFLTGIGKCYPLLQSPEVFNKVWQLRHAANWPQIDKFMGSEYFMQWEDYKDGRTHTTTAATQGPHS